MIIRMTNKLAQKLKIGPLTMVHADPGPYLEWYAHLFTADRMQYILVTEAKSLFSIMMYGRGISNTDRFLDQWIGIMRENLINSGNRSIYNDIFLPNLDKIILAKTLSKSILGSMNDMIRISSIVVDAEGSSPDDLSRLINRTIFKGINYQKPKDAFKKLKIGQE